MKIPENLRPLFGDAWSYRHFVLSAIRAEQKSRFARSKLGVLWVVLNPLCQAIIFAVVLAEVLGARFPGENSKAAYAIYLMAGMAAWSLFTEILNRSMNIFVEYGATIKKIAFPKICLPLIVWGGALVNHVLLLAAIAVVFSFLGHAWGWAWLCIPFGILLISLFAFGLGLVAGVFQVYTRDVGQVLTVVLQVWFWLTPVVYRLDMLPEKLQALVHLNPMYPLVGIYQGALLYDRWPNPADLLWPIGVTAGLCMLALLIFKRAAGELADAL